MCPKNSPVELRYEHRFTDEHLRPLLLPVESHSTSPAARCGLILPSPRPLSLATFCPAHLCYSHSLLAGSPKPHAQNPPGGGFPGGAVVESLPANAGDTGSSPGLGRSHMPRSGWAREPRLLSMRVWSLCSETREAAIVRGPRTAMKSGPRLPQLEKALAQKRRPNTAKKIN